MKKEYTGLKKVTNPCLITHSFHTNKTYNTSITGAISLSVGFLFGVTNVACGHVNLLTE